MKSDISLSEAYLYKYIAIECMSEELYFMFRPELEKTNLDKLFEKFIRQYRKYKIMDNNNEE